jgi:hypothetical protein
VEESQNPSVVACRRLMAAQVEEAMGALEEAKAAKGGLETNVLLARTAAAGQSSHSQLPGWGHAEAV